MQEHEFAISGLYTSGPTSNPRVTYTKSIPSGKLEQALGDMGWEIDEGKSTILRQSGEEIRYERGLAETCRTVGYNLRGEGFEISLKDYREGKGGGSLGGSVYFEAGIKVRVSIEDPSERDFTDVEQVITDLYKNAHEKPELREIK